MNIEKLKMTHYRIYVEMCLIIKKMSCMLKILMGLKMGFYIYIFHYILGRNVSMKFTVLNHVNWCDIAITGRCISPLTDTNTTNM